jgi:hypothetical protein
LHMFEVVTNVFSSFFWCFASVSDICCKCFIYFSRILQVLYSDVIKVDLMLHMLQRDPPTAAAGAPPSGHKRSSCAVG